MMLHYISEIIIFQLCFLLAYEVLLKKETFFSYNRWYLLLTPILAMLLPLLKIDFLAEAIPQNARVMLPAVVIGEQSIEQLPAVNFTAAQALQLNWWLLIYIAGLLINLFIFLKKYSTLNRMFRFRKISEEKDFSIIEIPNSSIACTFFSTVFMGDQLSEAERNHILSHELVHVREKHSLDLLIFEILKIFLWFNPLVYLYQIRLATIHEFIADKAAVQTSGRKTYYEHLLNTAFGVQNISFTNQFFYHSSARLTLFGRSFHLPFGGQVKKRIIMLQKKNSKTITKFKFLIIIPLMLAMLTYVACSENDIINPIPEKSLIYPGCEGLQSDEERKACMREKIKGFVKEQLQNGEELNEKEVIIINSIIDSFSIDSSGSIIEVKSRSSRPDLEAAVKRVIDSLPKLPRAQGVRVHPISPRNNLFDKSPNQDSDKSN